MAEIVNDPRTFGEYAQHMAKNLPGECHPRLYTGRYLVIKGRETQLLEPLFRSYPTGEQGIEALTNEIAANYMAPELTRYGLFMEDFLLTRVVSWLIERVPGHRRLPYEALYRSLVLDFNLAVRAGTGTHRVVKFDANGLIG